MSDSLANGPIVNGPGAAVLIPVLPNHRFDEAALCRYLEGALPGFRGPCRIRQFQGGQSNPTFHLETPDRSYVMRKRPPGMLLASAHAVDREFAVQDALRSSGVPVPDMLHLCRDESVVGTMFYVMSHVDGRVYADRLLPGCAPAERAAMYADMAEVLARLHRIDHRAVGLENYGRSDGYVARQVARWSKQYVASKLDDMPAMDRVMEWLPAHIPAVDEVAIAHGDYRIGNVVFHPTEPRVVAVLDWELSTIGHPTADLAYNCLAYRLASAGGGPAVADPDYRALGIPDEARYVAAYCRGRGLPAIADWEFFLAFAMFRLAAILAGVYRRGVDGNAADRSALEAGQRFKMTAACAWGIAQRIG
jgi:aminoglycoside phosphotransferase (APT) family kinase protein